MIIFKHLEEREIALFYAKKLNATIAQAILEKGSVDNSEEATELTRFYWNMVDESVIEKNNHIDHGFGDMDMWLECILNRFFFYLSNNGYETEWESH